MSKKSQHIAKFTQQFRGRELDAHYLGYFDCFNRQLFYEAHEVLEELWLADRRGANGDFYKGLIQLAGAFVHVQKNRPGPAKALLRLARANLEKFPEAHLQLNLAATLVFIEDWLRRLDTPTTDTATLAVATPPTLTLSGSRVSVHRA